MREPDLRATQGTYEGCLRMRESVEGFQGVADEKSIAQYIS